MIAALEWIGLRARWILAIGALGALFLQDLAAVLRPLLPALVALLYALAMVRIDLGAVLMKAIKPARLLRTVGVCLLLMVATPALLAMISRVGGLPTDLTEVLVYASAAPPLGSSAALCLLLGLNAAFALEVTILGSFLTPVLGPLVTIWLLGEAVPIDPLALALRLAAMIAGGAALAIVLRRLIGAETIARRASLFDGIGAVTMLVTIIPIFDGVTAQVLARPSLALGVLALVFAMNFGLQIVGGLAARRFADAPTAGASGLFWGNRNTALYLAALPQAPLLSLFVGLYQFPMYATPLLMRWFYARMARHEATVNRM